MADSTVNREMQMQLAMEACRQFIEPNFSAIARQFPPVNRQTLKRRFYEQQGSRASANSIHRQNLTNEQEGELIKLINSLTLRGLPPTSSIVRNLAEEIDDVPAQKASIVGLLRLEEIAWTRVCSAFEGNACLEGQ
jgi:hypothetical protein